jgi:hypothetical protein
MDTALSFVLVNPTGGATRWSEVQVRVGDDDTQRPEEKDVDTIPDHIFLPLETRLLSLGYSVVTCRFSLQKSRWWLGQVTATQPRAASS